MAGSLPDVLQLTKAGDHLYDAPHPADDPEGWNVVFSGQILAQMIMAAGFERRDEHEVKSIQAIFSRAGTYDDPMSLEAETTHAGRSFGSMTLTARQGERLLSRGMLLMNAHEPDVVRHGPTPPNVPGPDKLDPDPVSKGFPGSETRTLPVQDSTAADGTPEMAFWLRFPTRVKSVLAQQAMLAWSQPGELIGLALRPHSDQFSIADAHKTLSTGVIAHTIHFQERFDLADWVLVRQSATATGHGCVYGEGRVFDQAGRIVSTFSQDSMLRRAAARPAGAKAAL